MSVQIVIRDGNPWYFSPDIWVVPGSDPSGAPGQPIAGQGAYLWARVGNTGSTDANGVRVDFYWANPALQVTRSNATFVGSAYADVAAGGSQEALCLVPWTPVIVNGGHECLVAVANHPGDPLPSPLPDAFDPPSYRQVAQKNLTVLVASMHAMTLPLTISGLQRSEKHVRISAEAGGELDDLTLETLGLRGLRPARKSSVEVGLGREPRCLGEKDPVGKDRVDIRLARGETAGIHVALRVKGIESHEYAVVNIVERSQDRVLGGLGLVVVSADRGQREKS